MQRNVLTCPWICQTLSHNGVLSKIINMILLFLASIRKWDFMQHSSIMGSVTESNIILGRGRRTQNTAQKTHTLSNQCNGNVQVLHVWTSKCSCSLMFYLSFYLGCQVHLYYVSHGFVCPFGVLSPGGRLSFNCRGLRRTQQMSTSSHTASDILWFWRYSSLTWPLQCLEMTKQALLHN